MSQEELSRDEKILLEREIVDAQESGLLFDVILPVVVRVVAAHNKLTHSHAEACPNDNGTAVKIKKPFSVRSQSREYVAEMSIRRGAQPRELVAYGDKQDLKGPTPIGKAAIRAIPGSKELFFLMDGGTQPLIVVNLVDLWVAVAFLDQVHDK